jgi:hypothetical protein
MPFIRKGLLSAEPEDVDGTDNAWQEATHEFQNPSWSSLMKKIGDQWNYLLDAKAVQWH